MTIGEILTAIQNNVDETAGTTESVSTFYTTQQLVEWVNDAIKQLVNDLPAEILYDLHGEITATSSPISLPSDFFKPIELKIDGHIAKIIPPNQYWTGTDNPYSWADYYGVLYTDNTMAINPSPTVSASLKYLKAPAEYSTSDTASTPPIPTPYHNAIIYYATYLALRRDKEVAGDFIELYNKAISTGVSNDAQ